MIPSSHALVSLKPARQAAIQAISMVESSRERGARLPAMPYVRTFLRVLTGSGRLNATVARQIPGLNWVPKNRHANLKQIEEALDTMIATGGEACPLPLTLGVQAELFPEVTHTRTDRKLQRSNIRTTRQTRRESREFDQRWKLRQNLLAKAETDLNFQSPETVCTWYTRWSDEFDAKELAAMFWRWQPRFTSLKELQWVRLSGEPLYAVMYEIPFIVRETPEHTRIAERWQVPNKLRYLQEAE
ncbi:plasmid SOS inhibition protein A [Cedecea lapagei]|nr:plasmid SOS inhibition protein A [Cedecea lapagei]PKA32793.1 plasmid SOS inhibition protein A [Cedecea lapagei]